MNIEGKFEWIELNTRMQELNQQWLSGTKLTAVGTDRKHKCPACSACSI